MGLEEMEMALNQFYICMFEINLDERKCVPNYPALPYQPYLTSPNPTLII